MATSTFFTELTTTAAKCNALPAGPQRDACYIAAGYQVTGPNSYSKSTGITPAQIAPLAIGLIPGGTAAYQAVAGAVGAVRHPEPPAATMLQTPAPSFAPAQAAPVAASAPSGAGLDRNTMLILGGAALVFLLLLRH
jgi:hypothetical protein